jgi:opacity protein-like surface antigen
MKTKQLITGVALCGPLLVSNVKAQGLYLGIGGGYGFPAAKEANYDRKVSLGSTSNTTDYTKVNLSLGKGVNAGFFVGYMFNKNLGAELGVSYLFGTKTTVLDEASGNNVSQKNENINKGSMLRLTPTLKMMVGEGKLQPYMKIGMIVGVASKYTAEYIGTITNPGGSSSSQEIYEYTGGVSLGFHGGLGINYALSEKLSLFGEIAGNYQNWAPTKGELVTFTNDGVDELPLLTTYEKEVEFSNELTINSNTPANPGSPDQGLKFYLPFSSIGINIGLVFTLGGSK